MLFLARTWNSSIIKLQNILGLSLWKCWCLSGGPWSSSSANLLLAQILVAVLFLLILASYLCRHNLWALSGHLLAVIASGVSRGGAQGARAPPLLSLRNAITFYILDNI